MTRTKYRNVLEQRRRWAALDVLVPAQELRCAICGKLMTRRKDQSIDHVWPRIRGGFDGMGNWLATHRACNQRKSDRYPTGCELIMLHAINLKLRIETILVYPRIVLTPKGIDMTKRDEAPVIGYTADDFAKLAESAFIDGVAFNSGKEAANVLAHHFADVANEAVARTAREIIYQRDLIDVPHVDGVELLTGPNGKVWVNVNGKCIFRAATADIVRAEITKG